MSSLFKSHNPNKVVAHYNLGVILDKQGRLEDAEKEYREAIQHSPDHARAHYNLGVVLDKQARAEEAEIG